MTNGKETEPTFDDFNRAEKVLPEERRLRGEYSYAETRQVLRTREMIEKVLGSDAYNVGTYWYVDCYRDSEEKALEEIINLVPHGEISMLELGAGDGRVSALALEALRRMKGEVAMQKAASRLQTIDLMPKFVDAAQANLSKYGVPISNIIQGDYYDFPEKLKDREFNLISLILNNITYCTTKNDLMKLLSNVENCLENGGIFIFDTVELRHHENAPCQEALVNFDDLRSFYPLLIHFYRDSYMPNERGANIPRYPIRDRMSNGVFCDREIMEIEYLQYALQGSSLRQVTCQPIRKTAKPLSESRNLELGLEWIRGNGAEEWVRREIAYRSKQSGDIRPFYSLTEVEKNGIQLDTGTSYVDDCFYDVAASLPPNYVRLYYPFKKVG